MSSFLYAVFSNHYSLLLPVQKCSITYWVILLKVFFMSIKKCGVLLFFFKESSNCSSMHFHSFLMHCILYLSIHFMLKYYKQLVQKDQKADFFLNLPQPCIKKSDYSAVLPLFLRWSTTVIIANITSCNLIIISPSRLNFINKEISCKPTE